MTDTFPLIDESSAAFEAPQPIAETRPVDDLGVDETELEDGASESSTAGQQAAAKRAQRAQIRKIIAKADEVRGANKNVVKAAAQILGTGTDVADVTVAIMTAERGTTQVVTDFKHVRGSDMFSAATEAAMLGRDRLKRVWGLLIELGADLPAVPPAINSKAGLALAKAVFDLDEAQVKQIDAAAELIKKP